MMERSSKFLSLSGWAGVLAGIYALIGAYIAYAIFAFDPQGAGATEDPNMARLIGLALLVLVLAVGTAILLSLRQARKSGDRIWNPASEQLLVSMAVPLVVGGILLLILLSKGLMGLLPPMMLVFYGLALYGAGRYTFTEIRFLGLIQMGLGLIGAWFTDHGLLLWAIGFGILHIVYGLYIHLKYER